MQFVVAGDSLTPATRPRGIYVKSPPLPLQQYTPFARVLSDADETDGILRFKWLMCARFNQSQLSFALS